MDLKNLETAQNRKIGIKQSLKAISNGKAVALYIAEDAEQHVIRSIVEKAENQNIPIVYVKTMVLLGKACAIDVGAATAVIVK
jgi:large subunit ribosomal protein L7A